MECQHCGRESAVAPFCTWCGTRQGKPDKAGTGRRTDRFAAHPNESVVYPAVLTTLFPHLGNRQVNEYRWALVIGGAIIFALYLAGFIAAAILAGAVLVPLVYVMYLYEVRVYRDAPVQVVGLTLGGGIIVGILVTLVVNMFAAATPLVQSTSFGLVFDLAGIAVFAIAVPIVIEALKPLPALLLRRTGQFPETIDGLVFGVAAGLGFAAAETLIHLSSVITSGDLQTAPGNWIFPLTTLSILMPLMHATGTGLVTAAVWRGSRAALGGLGGAAVLTAVVGHVAFILGTEVLRGAGTSAVVPIVWQAAVVGAMLVVTRIVLHRALLDEAEDLGLRQIVCSNCDSHVLAGGFCPVCGTAVKAMSRDIGTASTAATAEEAGA